MPGFMKEVRNLISFLTIIPLGMDHDFLEDSAKLMALFPLVGGLIGVLAGSFAWVTSRVLPDTVVGVLTLGVLLWVTGVNHTDGLLDFGDGLMCHGPPEKKIQAMRDRQTGAGAMGLGMVTLLSTALGIASLRMGLVVQCLVVSEVAAKLSIVVAARAGKSAHKGMNEGFVRRMHGPNGVRDLVFSLGVSYVVAFILLGAPGCVAMTSGIVTGLVLVDTANRHFNGVTGDVFGAINEISRMVAILGLLVVLP